MAGPKKGLREDLKSKRNVPGKTRERRREKSGTKTDNETSPDIALHRIWEMSEICNSNVEESVRSSDVQIRLKIWSNLHFAQQ